MNYILLTVATVMNFLQQILQKQYNIGFNGKKNAEYYCIFFISLSALLTCVIISFFKGIDVNVLSIPYALLFGLFIGIAMLFQLFAIKTGPLSITSLVMSCSLLIPTLYGIVFCNEHLSVYGSIGIICVFVAFPLIVDYNKNDIIKNKRYIIFLVIGAVSNGLCSTMLKIHDQVFEGRFSSFFTIIAYAFVAITMLIFVLLNKMTDVDHSLKVKGVIRSSASGMMNGLSNTIILFLAGVIPASIVYPFVSAGVITLAFFASLFIYKEKIKPYKYLGYILGAVSVVLLSI